MKGINMLPTCQDTGPRRRRFNAPLTVKLKLLKLNHSATSVARHVTSVVCVIALASCGGGEPNGGQTTEGQASGAAEDATKAEILNNPNRVAPIDTSNRAEVLARWLDTYLDNTPTSWTGSVVGCNVGQTSDAYKAAVVRRVNFFRSMAGVEGSVVLDLETSAKAQQAAIMMDAHDRLSHYPTSDWPCFTGDGAEAARKSNLSYSSSSVSIGLKHIDVYMRDQGANNGPVGHRRWILWPELRRVGTGDTSQANVLWVIPPSRPQSVRSAPSAVTWPPAGFFPRPLGEPTDRFSLSCTGADFSDATVNMLDDTGKSIGVVVKSRSDHGFGDNTLVWSVAAAAAESSAVPPLGWYWDGGVDSSYFELPSIPEAWDRGSQDTRLDIEVSNVKGCAAGSEFNYSVTFINP